MLGLEHAWHFQHFDPTHAPVPLIWYLGFYALFTIFPFVFHKRFAGKTVPWATAARLLVHCTFILSTSSFALRIPAEFPVWCRLHLRCQRYLDCLC